MRSLLVLLLVTPALLGCLGASDDALDPNTTDDVLAPGFSDTHVYPGDYDTNSSYARVLDPGPFDLAEPTVHRIPSELDGADIQLSVRMPEVPDGVRVPVIAIASPYLFNGFDWDGGTAALLLNDLLPHGYAGAFIAVRGSLDSGGCSDLWGPKERADLDQAVTWLGEQPWSNGNVALIGVSYVGTTPWVVASTGNPHLKTIVPISGLTDPFDMIWRNGTVKSVYTTLVPLFYGPYGFGLYNPATPGQRSAEHTVDSVVCPEAWEGTLASGTASGTGEPDPFGYWDERDLRPGTLGAYEGSVLLVHGLQDWNVVPSQAYPFVNQLEEQGVVVKHLLGQWGHTWAGFDTPRNPSVRWDAAEVLLHWFDRWLKEDTSVDLGPPAQVQDSSGQWRSGDSWPPAAAEATPLYLAPEGELLPTPADTRASHPISQPVKLPGPERAFEDHNSTIEWWKDPAVDLCPVCATFTTSAMVEELRFAGLPRVHVTVTPQGPGGQLTAYLYSVDGTGEAQRLGWGAIDLRFADGTREAQAVTPGQAVLAKLQLEPLDAVVPVGSRLVLQLHQGGYGDNHLPAKTPFPVDVEVGGEQSQLVIGVFDVPEGAFFAPPGVDL